MGTNTSTTGNSSEEVTEPGLLATEPGLLDLLETPSPWIDQNALNVSIVMSVLGGIVFSVIAVLIVAAVVLVVRRSRNRRNAKDKKAGDAAPLLTDAPHSEQPPSELLTRSKRQEGKAEMKAGKLTNSKIVPKTDSLDQLKQEPPKVKAEEAQYIVVQTEGTGTSSSSPVQTGRPTTATGPASTTRAPSNLGISKNASVPLAAGSKSGTTSSAGVQATTATGAKTVPTTTATTTAKGTGATAAPRATATSPTTTKATTRKTTDGATISSKASTTVETTPQSAGSSSKSVIPQQ